MADSSEGNGILKPQRQTQSMPEGGCVVSTSEEAVECSRAVSTKTHRLDRVLDANESGEEVESERLATVSESREEDDNLVFYRK